MVDKRASAEKCRDANLVRRSQNYNYGKKEASFLFVRESKHVRIL